MEDMADHMTTLTYGGDVADVMGNIIGNKETFSETYHITSDRSINWGVLKVYEDVILRLTGKNLKIMWLNDTHKMINVLNRCQVKYDRMYDRAFDNIKICVVCGKKEYMEVNEGLTLCLKEFIKNGLHFNNINWALQAHMDRLVHERTELSESSTGIVLSLLSGKYLSTVILYNNK